MSLASTVALLTGFSSRAWAEGSSSVGSMSGALFLVVLAAIVAGIIMVASHLTSRRKRLDEALVLQARVSDMLLRERQLGSLMITPKARVPVRRAQPVTIEIEGAVPTPEVRETVLRLVRAEVSKEGSDIITEDHLYIVPQMRQAS